MNDEPANDDQQQEVEDQNVLLKKLVEAITGSSELQPNLSENVAQLIAAAVSQVVQHEGGDVMTGNTQTSDDTPDYQHEYLTPADNVESTVEVSAYSDQRSLGVKFPSEMRRRIIGMRKEGIKCKDIAKNLGASVSGVQKVWERFLATGTIHDRKPSTYAGRPRRFHFETSEEGVVTISSDNYVNTTVGVAMPTQAVLISTGDNTVKELPMEAPGATVEVIASVASHEMKTKKKSGGAPSYREELLLKLVNECPLAMMKGDVNMTSNLHLQNLKESMNKPLYMEYVLGHPFGKVPAPRPFEADPDESKVILSDPCNPLGKEVISALGYSTKVYFNACCKPSCLFKEDEIYHNLPYSIGPHHIGENMREVLQLLLNMSSDPCQSLKLIPEGPGLILKAQDPSGEIITQPFTPPTKLSDYWGQLYAYAQIFECCENFLSPGPPSAPCLLCHPFESFANNLQIKDPNSPSSPVDISPSSALLDTATQLLQLHPESVEELSNNNVLCTPTVTMTTNDSLLSHTLPHEEEVCLTEEVIDNNQVDTMPDGIHYVAYSSDNRQDDTHSTSSTPRRSSRKRPNPNYISNDTCKKTIG